jgi:large subunit ribosomal protein L6
MSRIGRMPITVPGSVQVSVDGQKVTVKGPKGELDLAVAEPIKVAVDDGTVTVTRPDDERRSRQLHGLTRTLVNNMVIGVTDGYAKTLEVVGTGYRVQAKGNGLELALGFSHPVSYDAPDGISFQVETPTRFRISGIDKQLVGEVAANIRKLRAPEPYKGKGVKYKDEYIFRKEGKKK